jgi:hypothetical protein
MEPHWVIHFEISLMLDSEINPFEVVGTHINVVLREIGPGLSQGRAGGDMNFARRR